MSNQDYVQVRSHYYPEGGNPDLILEADGTDAGEWAYAFIYDLEDIPEYLKVHERRNEEAKSLDEERKLSRMTEDHMIEDAEGEWRELE